MLSDRNNIHEGVHQGWCCCTSPAKLHAASEISHASTGAAPKLAESNILTSHKNNFWKAAGLYVANIKHRYSKCTTACSCTKTSQTDTKSRDECLMLSQVPLCPCHGANAPISAVPSVLDIQSPSPHSALTQPAVTLPCSSAVTLTPILQPCRSRTYLVWWLPEGLQCSWRPSGITESRGQRLAAPRAERSRRASANTSRTWGNLMGRNKALHLHYRHQVTPQEEMPRSIAFPFCLQRQAASLITGLHFPFSHRFLGEISSWYHDRHAASFRHSV